MYINSMSELTAMTFCVPNDLEAQAREEIHQLLDELVAAHAGDYASDEGPVSAAARFEVLSAAAARKLGNSWKLPAWELSNEAERERGRWVIQQCTTPARQTLRLFVERPERVNTSDIRQLLDVEARSVPGVLRAISSHCRRVRRRPCWHWTGPKEDPQGVGYVSLDDDLVEILTWGFASLDS